MEWELFELNNVDEALNEMFGRGVDQNTLNCEEEDFYMDLYGYLVNVSND